MNCYHKILQKNVYRTCAGNCDEIASVTTFHRNDKFRVIIANAVRIVIARSLLRRRGHLLAMGLQATCDEIASVTTFLRNDKKRVVSRLPRRVFYTARNDKVLWQEPRASRVQVTKSVCKCKDSKKCGVSLSTRVGSGKWLCEV